MDTTPPISIGTIGERVGTEVWKEYIANLRDHHRALRALEEELESAGL